MGQAAPEEGLIAIFTGPPSCPQSHLPAPHKTARLLRLAQCEVSSVPQKGYPAKLSPKLLLNAISVQHKWW